PNQSLEKCPAISDSSQPDHSAQTLAMPCPSHHVHSSFQSPLWLTTGLQMKESRAVTLAGKVPAAKVGHCQMDVHRQGLLAPLASFAWLLCGQSDPDARGCRLCPAQASDQCR